MFNSYVRLPEGNFSSGNLLYFHIYVSLLESKIKNEQNTLNLVASGYTWTGLL
jgi:hypothetical protein